MSLDILLRIARETAVRHGLSWDGTVPLSGSGLRLGDLLDRQRREPPRHLQSRQSIPLGPYIFFPVESYLEQESAIIRLTEKERDILLLLLDAAPDSVNRKQLLDSVWGYASGVETHTQETHIYRLRQKIESNPARPALLVTDGEGYKLGTL